MVVSSRQEKLLERLFMSILFKEFESLCDLVWWKILFVSFLFSRNDFRHLKHTTDFEEFFFSVKSKICKLYFFFSCTKNILCMVQCPLHCIRTTFVLSIPNDLWGVLQRLRIISRLLDVLVDSLLPFRKSWTTETTENYTSFYNKDDPKLMQSYSVKVFIFHI